jgi:hypothetical protein
MSLSPMEQRGNIGSSFIPCVRSSEPAVDGERGEDEDQRVDDGPDEGYPG